MMLSVHPGRKVTLYEGIGAQTEQIFDESRNLISNLQR